MIIPVLDELDLGVEAIGEQGRRRQLAAAVGLSGRGRRPNTEVTRYGEQPDQRRSPKQTAVTATAPVGLIQVIGPAASAGATRPAPRSTAPYGPVSCSSGASIRPHDGHDGVPGIVTWIADRSAEPDQDQEPR